MNFFKALSLIPSRGTLHLCLKRNLGACSTLYINATATDPIQKLFLDKLREYAKKSEKQGGGIVDASPGDKKELEDTLTKLKTQYGADKADFTKFPTFTFTEPKLDPISLEEKQ